MDINIEKLSKPEKALYKTNRIFALFLLVMGVIFIAIPRTVAGGLPYLLFAVILFNSVVMIFKSIKAQSRGEKIFYIVIGVISVSICVLFIVFRERKQDIVAILMAVHTFTEIGDCVYDIICHKKEKRKVVLKSLTLGVYTILLAELFIELGASVPTHVVIYGMMFVSQGASGIYANVKKEFNGSSLREVIARSYTAEILFGLLIVVTGAAILLPAIEPSIKTFGDGLWYSFMLVTTIGFGDMTAVTPAGRLISVIVGIYGIVVVALVTSILVNLYNEKKEKDRRADEGNKSDKTKNSSNQQGD